MNDFSFHRNRQVIYGIYNINRISKIFREILDKHVQGETVRCNKHFRTVQVCNRISVKLITVSTEKCETNE